MTTRFKENGYTKETSQELIDKRGRSGYLVKFMTENKVELMDILDVMEGAGFQEKRRNLEEEIESRKSDSAALAAKLDNVIYAHLLKSHGMTKDAAMNDLARFLDSKQEPT